MRDLLIETARLEVYQARWTDHILDEVFRNIKINRPDLNSSRLDRTRHLMCKNVKNCLVTDYENLIPTVTIPDPDDRHVLAAAIKAQAQYIVTENLRDFPIEILSYYKISPVTADEFLVSLIRRDPEIIDISIDNIVSRLKNPPLTRNVFLQHLTRNGAPQAAKLLKI